MGTRAGEALGSAAGSAAALVEHEDEVGLADALEADLAALRVRNTASMRAVRRKYSRLMRRSDPAFVLRLAKHLLQREGRRWLGYEMVRDHPGAFALINASELEALGRGLNSWWTVDEFGRMLAGPAWLARQVPDKLILNWARSPDRWWRRAALVSTVALNMRSQGGYGDTRRTLQVCGLLVKDHDDMVVKGLSWALRALVAHDAAAVAAFLEQHRGALAARVKREVGSKLRTGLKNPRRRAHKAS